MIEFKNFWFRYPNSTRWALKDLNLKIRKGEFVFLVGPSGSGKSTLIRAINALIPHFYSGEMKGDVLIFEKRVSHTSPNELLGIVATVFQNPENQMVMNTVEREIAFPLENLGLEEEEITRRVEESLDVIGIAHLKKRKVSELSGGEKQKVAIAASVAVNPDFMLLDEPTSQLSPSSSEDILGLLERLNDDMGIGIILVEHRLERVMHRADRMLVLDGGVLLADGEPRIVASRVDMDALGVGYPQVIRLAKLLDKDFLPLTVKEGRRLLGKDVLNFKFSGSDGKFGEKILSISKVFFSYGAQPVLKNLTMELHRGEILGVVGRNGSGKTTLAKLIAGLLKPDKGKITIFGKNLEKIDAKSRSKLVGMVFQNPNFHLFGDTIYEDISLGVKDISSVERVMKRLGIWELRHRNSRDLSGGERMLAAIASVAVLNPRILILDEPTRGLSYALKLRVASFLKEYSRRNSVLLISHDMEMIARTAHRVSILADGRMVVAGDKRRVMAGALNYTTQLNKMISSIRGTDRRILLEEDIEGLS